MRDTRCRWKRYYTVTVFYGPNLQKSRLFGYFPDYESALDCSKFFVEKGCLTGSDFKCGEYVFEICVYVNGFNFARATVSPAKGRNEALVVEVV